MEPRRRIALVGLLVVLTLGLCVHYGATEDRNWPHPTGDQLADDPGGWDGERVLLFGEVRAQTADGFVMTVEDDSGAVVQMVTVRGTDASVEVGGVVQVYGRLSEQGTVQQAESVVVVTESPGDERNKLAASLLGGLAAAALFVRYWRIEPRALGFVARERTGNDAGGEEGG